MHFTDTYLPRRDGVITSLQTLRAAQQAAGHPSLCVVPQHSEQADEPGLLRLPALPCGVADLRLSHWPLRGAGLRDRLVAQLAEHRPDVVHVHTPGPVGLLGILAARRLGLPLVQTYHTDLHAYADAYRVPAWALRILLRLYAGRLGAPAPAARSGGRAGVLDAGNQLLLGDADVVVVPTRAVLDRVTLPVPPEWTFLVPTGVAARRASPEQAEAFRAEHGIAPTDPVLLFVGRVNREKGVDLLIPAFEKVLAVVPTARLVVVGAVYEPNWLAGLLKAVGPEVAQRIVVTGQQPPQVVATAYAAADVFAFPSRTDTQALVLQESALAGVPAVLADPLLHQHGPLGGNAICAEPTPEAFGAALTGLLTDRAAGQRLAEAAAGSAARHSPADYAIAMLEVYQAARARSAATQAALARSAAVALTPAVAQPGWASATG
jgi:glycosyltransferase involved in cell wall biosynthesis